MNKKYYSPSTKGFYDSDIHEVMPEDCKQISDQVHKDLLDAQSSGKVIRPNIKGIPVAVDPDAPTAEVVYKSLVNGIQRHLDSKARERGYDSIASAISYAEEPSVPVYQAEGQAFRAWRSLVWFTCYSTFPTPESLPSNYPTLEDVISQLPAFTLS